MKRRTVLLVLAVMIAVVIAVSIYYTAGPEPESPVSDEPADDQRVEISLVEIEDIQTMELVSPQRTLRFFKEGEQWQVEHPYPIVLDQNSVIDLAYSFGRLYSEKVIDPSPADLTRYGLDPPQVVGKATLKDGMVLELYLGNSTPVRNTYYLMAKDDPVVYAVWANHGLHLSYELADVRQKEIGRINKQEIVYIKIARKGRPTLEIHRAGQEMFEKFPYLQSEYYLSGPYQETIPIDREALVKFLSSLPPQFKVARFVDDNPVSLAPYGLDPPLLELMVRDTETDLHLFFGKDLEDSLIYFRVAGEKAVHALEKRELGFLQIKPFELIEKFAFIVSIDYVDRITLRYEGREHTFSIDRKQEGDEDTTFRVNGSEVEQAPFRQIYQSLIGLVVEAEREKPAIENPELVLTYTLNSGVVRNYRLSFVPYDADFLALFKNDSGVFLISRQQIRNMLEDVEKFLKEQVE